MNFKLMFCMHFMHNICYGNTYADKISYAEKTFQDR